MDDTVERLVDKIDNLRAERDALKAEVERLRATIAQAIATADRWARADWPLTGCASGEDVPTLNSCGSELLQMLEENHGK